MLSAIIVAAGSSRRMGRDKLLEPLADSTVLDQTISRFLASPEVQEVILVCPEERFQKLCTRAETLVRVDGGKERHNSVLAGLKAIRTDATHVAIHDGARPLVTPEAINACYQKSQETGAATLARPATETIKKADEQQRVIDSIPRDDLWFMETPQIFSVELIKQAYAEVEKRDEIVTDEVSALQLIGQDTTLVNSPCFNPKITYPSDLTLAEKFLS